MLIFIVAMVIPPSNNSLAVAAAIHQDFFQIIFPFGPTAALLGVQMAVLLWKMSSRSMF
ncbi:hypothetical protein TanjilG_17353 [Lupinus angustifolius]|uniref:Uncharacterized protein n=1 Tax=Lupinus angustifolius TaxID=3871 RepID=A0A4P1R1L1_LUPAN|nr:hypothetical protein TanjilG_17353 [Lupinus angustifolius]